MARRLRGFAYTYPPHPGEFEATLCLLVVILSHARLGLPFALLPSMLTTNYLSSNHLVRVRSRTEMHGAIYVRSEGSGHNAPLGERYNVICQDNECGGWVRVHVGTTRSHP